MSAWARPGVKCACVDDSGMTSVVKGLIYTIVSVAPEADAAGRGGVELAEVRPITHPKYFIVDRFRPLITKTQEQDVAMFTHHFDREGADA